MAFQRRRGGYFQDYAFDRRAFSGREIRAQIDAAEAAGAAGWMLWNPRNRYMSAGLRPAQARGMTSVYQPFDRVGNGCRLATFTAKRPLLTIQRVLCPGSLQGLDRGLALAPENAARVTVLHVVELPSEDPLFVDASLPLSQYVALSTNRAADALARAVPAGAHNWCDIRTLVRTGQPAAVILGEAVQGNVDLIVMGS